MMLQKTELQSFARSERDQFERTLKQFVEVPSVSSEPDRHRDIRRCAELAAQTIRDYGGEPKILETAGYPIIHGRFNTRTAAPVVTVYNHLDGQPVSRETEPWDTDPF